MEIRFSLTGAYPRIYDNLVAYRKPMTHKELSNTLEQWAPLELAEDFDNVGWLIQTEENKISGILVAHDALETVVEEAYQKACNVIVCYHPIIFTGIKAIDPKHYVSRAISAAIKRGVSIYCLHTALDKVIGGVNDLMGNAIKLEQSTFLLPQEQGGMGRIGYLKNPMTGIDFLKQVQSVFQTPMLRHSTIPDKPIKKVAVIGGSGAFGIEAALAQHADALLTGDLKYHDFFKPNGELLLIDVGHFESERFTKNAIAKYLQEKFSNFAVTLSELNTNPVGYYTYGEE